MDEKSGPFDLHVYKQKANQDDVKIWWSNYKWPNKGRDLNKSSVYLQSQSVSDRLWALSQINAQCSQADTEDKCLSF